MKDNLGVARLNYLVDVIAVDALKAIADWTLEIFPNINLWRTGRVKSNSVTVGLGNAAWQL